MLTEIDTSMFARVWRVAVAGVLLCSVACFAADDEAIALYNELHVYASSYAPSIDVTRPGPVAAAFASMPGLLVNSQGGTSAQTDGSVRGSSFSEVGLEVAGLPLRSHQTEHFNLELPIPAALLQSPELITGFEQATRPAGHLVGTVSFDFADVRDRRGLTIGIGETDRYWQDLFIQNRIGDEAGVSFFASHETANSLDYGDNDLSRVQGGVHSQLQKGNTRWDVVVAAQEKKFGARGYYGVTPLWGAEEELDDILVLGAGSWEGSHGRSFRGALAWRTIEDEYRLFWTRPGVYENQHRGETLSGALSGRMPLAEHVSIGWGGLVESTDLKSSALGDHDRMRADLTVAPEVSFGALTLRAGVQGALFSEDSPDALPMGACSVAIGDRHELFASYTEATREPSYTELNYESPGSLGNSGLERQTSRGLELGWAGRLCDAASMRVVAFGRRSDHTVDWAKIDEPSGRWVATDLGRVETVGVECLGRLAVSERLDLDFGATLVDKSSDAEIVDSRYVLNYAEQLFEVAAHYRLSSTLSINVSETLREQERVSAVADSSGADAAASLRWQVGSRIPVDFVLTCHNLWDDRFEVYLDQPVKGRYYTVAARVTWL